MYSQHQKSRITPTRGTYTGDQQFINLYYIYMRTVHRLYIGRIHLLSCKYTNIHKGRLCRSCRQVVFFRTALKTTYNGY